MKKIISILITCLIIGLIVFISGCLDNHVSEDNKNQNINLSENSPTNNSSIEPGVKEIKMTEIVNTLKELKPTAEPYQFKEGETYIYHIRISPGPTTLECEPIEADIPIHITSERINKSEYWILTAEQVNLTPRCRIPLPNGGYRMGYLIENGDGTPIPLPVGGSIIAVNKENLFDSFAMNSINSLTEETFVEIPPEWAFYLKDNIKIVKESKGTFGEKECKDRVEISVIGSEKINGKDCFKVEVVPTTDCIYVSSTGKGGTILESLKEVYWIDKQTRIIMKYQRYSVGNEGSFLDSEVELKEIKKPYK